MKKIKKASVFVPTGKYSKSRLYKPGSLIYHENAYLARQHAEICGACKKTFGKHFGQRCDCN